MRYNYILRYFVAIVMIASHLACTAAPENTPQTNETPTLAPRPGWGYRGYVFDSTDTPLRNVVVSDGYNCAKTDSLGRYFLPDNSLSEFLFVSLPAGYAPDKRSTSPLFYRMITKKNDCQANFRLQYMGDDSAHTLMVCADPQLANDHDKMLFSQGSVPDIASTIQSISSIGKRVVGISLGDLVFDQMNYFPFYSQQMASLGILYFHVIGNHDHNLNMGEPQCEENFKQWFGPTYYSFNLGSVHYVVLDNVNYSGKKIYNALISARQLDWLTKDLLLIPKSHKIVICGHIPLLRSSSVKLNPRLIEIINGYDVFFMSGHTHYTEHIEHELGYQERVHQTLCGTWWQSNHSVDGTPNGYYLYHVDSTSLVSQFIPTQLPHDHQMRLYPVGTSAEHPSSIIANIYNWDPAWKVEWYENDVPQGSPLRFTGIDPFAQQLYIEGKHKKEPTNNNMHLFRFTPSNTNAKIRVTATDPQGRVFNASL